VPPFHSSSPFSPVPPPPPRRPHHSFTRTLGRLLTEEGTVSQRNHSTPPPRLLFLLQVAHSICGVKLFFSTDYISLNYSSTVTRVFCFPSLKFQLSSLGPVPLKSMFCLSNVPITIKPPLSILVPSWKITTHEMVQLFMPVPSEPMLIELLTCPSSIIPTFFCAEAHSTEAKCATPSIPIHCPFFFRRPYKQFRNVSSPPYVSLLVFREQFLSLSIPTWYVKK